MSLARSNLGVERTLVYYETAAAAGIPLVLHPFRYEASKAIDAACCDAYLAVKEVLRTTFEGPIRSQLDSLGQTHTVAVPPPRFEAGRGGRKGRAVHHRSRNTDEGREECESVPKMVSRHSSASCRRNNRGKDRGSSHPRRTEACCITLDNASRPNGGRNPQEA